LTIVLSVLLWYTDSDCPFGIFWPLCCLFFFDIRILIAPLVSFDHWRRTDNTMVKRYQRSNQNLYIKEEQTTQWSKDTKGAIRICISKKNRQHNGQKIPKEQSESVYRPLCCLFFFDIQILIAPLVSFDHCVVCSSLIYRFWLPLWYLLTIVLSVLLWYTDSDCSFGIFWPLCCLFFFQSESVYQRRTDNTMVKRYQRSNQNMYIKEEQTTQWSKDTKGAIRFFKNTII
jgi:phage FluMu protein Com